MKSATHNKFAGPFSFRLCLLIAAVGLVLVFCSQNTSAQTGNSSVGGTVLDQQGRVISGAIVNLSNLDKGLTRTASKGDNGNFMFPAIPSGTYRLEIALSGFKTFVQNDVHALVDTPASLSVILEPGSINEVVNVTSSGAETLLNTQDARIGNPFSSGEEMGSVLRFRDFQMLSRIKTALRIQFLAFSPYRGILSQISFRVCSLSIGTGRNEF